MEASRRRYIIQLKCLHTWREMLRTVNEMPQHRQSSQKGYMLGWPREDLRSTLVIAAYSDRQGIPVVESARYQTSVD